MADDIADDDATEREPVKKRYCTICGVRHVEVGGGMCDPCKERLRLEAMGGQADTGVRADQALRKHGVTPKR